MCLCKGMIQRMCIFSGAICLARVSELSSELSAPVILRRDTRDGRHVHSSARPKYLHLASLSCQVRTKKVRRLIA